MSVSARFELDQRVEVNWQNGSLWFAAKVANRKCIDEAFMYLVHYEDGDIEHNVPEQQIRRFKFRTSFPEPEDMYLDTSRKEEAEDINVKELPAAVIKDPPVTLETPIQDVTPYSEVNKPPSTAVEAKQDLEIDTEVTEKLEDNIETPAPEENILPSEEDVTSSNVTEAISEAKPEKKRKVSTIESIENVANFEPEKITNTKPAPIDIEPDEAAAKSPPRKKQKTETEEIITPDPIQSEEEPTIPTETPNIPESVHEEEEEEEETREPNPKIPQSLHDSNTREGFLQTLSVLCDEFSKSSKPHIEIRSKSRATSKWILDSSIQETIVSQFNEAFDFKLQVIDGFITGDF